MSSDELWYAITSAQPAYDPARIDAWMFATPYTPLPAAAHRPGHVGETLIDAAVRKQRGRRDRPVGRPAVGAEQHLVTQRRGRVGAPVQPGEQHRAAGRHGDRRGAVVEGGRVAV